MKADRFWRKVHRCKHENMSPDYYEYIHCETPYCGGSEEHCLDCGVFIATCGCGSNNGLSGWSEKRHKKIRFKEFIKRRIEDVKKN